MNNIIMRELASVFIPFKKQSRYIVQTQHNTEGKIIYEFWKEMGVKILDSTYENYSIGLFNIYYSKTDFSVSYYSCHSLIANIECEKQSHSYYEFKKRISRSCHLYDLFCQIEDRIRSEENNNRVYLIKFKSPNKLPNWVNISNIDKTTLDEFIDYLYALKRNINILPYICGGLSPGPHADLDRTYLVQRIVDDIKKNFPKNELLNKHIVHCWDYPETYDNPFDLFFKEDVYEFMEKNTTLSKNDLCCFVSDLPYTKVVKKKIFKNIEIFNTFSLWLTNNEHNPWIGTSRWEFIYMFRNEFKKFMRDKGYKVVVDGGWVLNDKQREIKLGLIDENGELY